MQLPNQIVAVGSSSAVAIGEGVAGAVGVAEEVEPS